MSDANKCHILLVEDEPGDAALIKHLLAEAAPKRYNLEVADSLAATKAYLTRLMPELILLDLTLPDSSGLETVRAVHALMPTVPIVVLTGHADDEFALSTLEAGAQDYLVKGRVSGDDLLRAIRHARVRAQLEARLVASQQRLQALLAAVPDIIVQVDSNQEYTWANSAGFDFFGEDLLGRAAADFWVGEESAAETIYPQPGGDEVIYRENLQRRRDGKARLLAWWSRVLKDDQGRVTGSLSSARDITEQRKLEEQLRQAQKMESVGTLAGGIAHDFNNLLTAIIGYCQISQLSPSADEALRGNLEQIMAASKRGAHLTQGLLLFSRKQSSERKPVDLNEVVVQVERFLQRMIGEDIELRVECCRDALPVLADAHQLEQVLLNLATNARDAMPTGGIFSLATSLIELDADFVAEHGYGKPGVYARLSVSDSGQGMSPETSRRVFEPFFTTKEVGQGTGLGLAVAYGIVQQHEGYIQMYSEPDKGTTFRIYLPLLVGGGRQSRGATGARTPELVLKGAGETILVAEDDAAIRQMTRSVLEKFNYRVIEAVDGEDAVAKFQQHRDEIDLLLFDLIMPRLNGKEAYDAIAAQAPGVRCLFASGYAPDLLRRKVSLDRQTPLLCKPMSINDLLTKVRQVLDRNG
ncbi:hybrid sensor histidine kinase/response regulator [Desulfurivibrio alkaliphilus]|uniref:histidine kinase n=1 Tax=Desulfurivibrio alkaliphilus (strain DSM 19089 / UNIQEM U267 / AHT2) TaxID=589865 RepID=D6Z3S8_DESAT|nr:response regulator [Desulfurivibrio alkaliphilus]ADH86203.1 PAS/PAC sensor hybrid histidine kinase [Desulfurivibrio alkaliphilus AHT 2]